MTRQGFSTLEVMIGAAVLVVALMAAMGGVTYYTTMNAATSRRGDATDYIRIRLATIKGVVLSSGGLLAYVQSIENAQGLYNPLLTVNLNDPTVFQAQFGFPQTDRPVLHNIDYRAVFAINGFKFDASMNPQPIVLGGDHLRDLAFLTISADLTPPANVPAGTDSAAARHGEVYIGK